MIIMISFQKQYLVNHVHLFNPIHEKSQETKNTLDYS